MLDSKKSFLYAELNYPEYTYIANYFSIAKKEQYTL